MRDGIFQTNLGDTTPLPGSVDFNTDNIYLGIEFNSNGEMTPRIQFTAVPYAFNANNLQGKDWSAPGAIGSTTPNSAAFTTLSSNSTTNLSTGGGSTFAIGNSTGTGTIASGGTSSWTNTSGPLTISTASSGTLAMTSAGALNLSAASASTVTLANVANALNFDSDTLTIDALGNRIGIGTTAPNQKLSVNGTLGIAGTTAPYYTIFQGGAQAANITYTLPTSTPVASGYALVSTTSGVMSWASVAGSIGIGTTVGSATAGSVFFAGTSGILQQDNANFFWDNAAKRLGIGTTSPSATLTIGSPGDNTARSINFPDTGSWINAERYEISMNSTGNVYTGINTDDAGSDKFSITSGSSYSPIFTALYTGNVGIGTTNPQNALQIYVASANDSVAKFTNSVTGQAVTDGFNVGVDNNGDANLWNIENSKIFFATNDQERMTILAGGNVGIGTTNPQAMLEIYNSATDYTRLSGPTIILQSDNSLDAPFSVDLTGAASLIANFSDSGASALAIKNGGNVGIGTTNPGQKLSVEGTLGILETGGSPQYHTIFQGGDQAGNVTYTLPTTTPVASGYALVSTTGGVMSWSVMTGGGMSNPMTTTGDIIYGSAGGAPTRLAGSGTNGWVLKYNTGTSAPYWAAEAGGGPWTDGTGISYLTDITEDLGIGSTSLVAPFSVDVSLNTVRIGSGSTNNGILNMYASNGATGSLEYTANDSWYFNGGNVGIGTSSPGASLHISGTTEQLRLAYDADSYVKLTTSNDSKLTLETAEGNQSMIKVGKGAAQDAGVSFDGNTNDYYMGMDDATDKFMIGIGQTIGATPYLTMDSSGNFGIGTTAPSAQLHTTGTVRFANFGAGTLQTDANGNLSVSSDERLKDISGDFTRGLDEIMKIKPITYKWNDISGMETEHEYSGFSAQNVQASIPEAVGIDSRGFLTLSDRTILAALLNGVKEQQSKMIDIQKIQDGIQDGGLVLEERISKVEDSVQKMETQGLTLETKVSEASSLVSDQQAAISKIESQLALLTQGQLAQGTTAPEVSGQYNPLPSADISQGVTLQAVTLDIKQMTNNGALVIGTPVEFQGPAVFKAIAEFIDKVIFRNDVEFASHVMFDQDTAGYALVQEGRDKVAVTFEKEYAVAPVVNASLSLQQIEDPEVRQAAEELLLVSDVKFIITNVTEKGFEIKIDQKAISEIPFSWQAIAVKDPKISGEKVAGDSLGKTTDTPAEMPAENLPVISESAPEAGIGVSAPAAESAPEILPETTPDPKVSQLPTPGSLDVPAETSPGDKLTK